MLTIMSIGKRECSGVTERIDFLERAGGGMSRDQERE
jgi:hypothetical protein